MLEISAGEAIIAYPATQVVKPRPVSLSDGAKVFSLETAIIIIISDLFF